MPDNIISEHSVVDGRLSLMQDWALSIFPQTSFSLVPLAGDASFRRYFRLLTDEKSYVVMDAPPEKENCDAFITIAKSFQDSLVRFPHIYSMDLERGFLLLSDFGDKQLLPLLKTTSVDGLYQSAMDVLLKMQSHDGVAKGNLPYFDSDLFWKEFDIFDTWYIQKNLNKKLSAADSQKLKTGYQGIIDFISSQPTVFVHRDYHSRNIMLCDDNELGVLDFQDAVQGSIVYDLVSLLRDCYIAWPDEKVQAWVNYFYTQLQSENKIPLVSFDVFMRWFDWTGLQRHLKCLGIFSRLHYRDHKNGYLKEIPRVLNYVLAVCEKYPELSSLCDFVK